ncbi:MAG: RNA polymerase sigma factor, partial [Limisphaerales bacterium]
MDPESDDPLLLLEAARAGDAEAFGELCRMIETRLLRQAFSLCRDAEFAEDLAQETLVEAWRSLRRYNGKCELFTWLCAILLNRYRNSLRKKRVEMPPGLHDGGEYSHPMEVGCPDPAMLPDEAAALHENAMLVQKCIRKLPAKHQQIIYLRFFVDDSLDGIAAALGCSVGTVKSRLFHA